MKSGSGKISFFLLVFLLLPANTLTGKTAYIGRAELVHLREGPGRDYEPLDILRRGQVVEIREDLDGWSFVQLEDGRAGYVFSKYLLLPVEDIEAQEPLPEEGKSLEQEVQNLKEELTALKTKMATPPDETTQQVAHLREENARLVEENLRLQGLLNPHQKPTPDPLPSPASGNFSVTSTLLLSIFSLMFGWFMGFVYYRRRDRIARTRLRF